MPTPPLSQPLLQTLPLQIADQIAASIVKGSYASGSKLREVELSQLFNVSRATVREALRLLEQRNLVQIRPQRGAHVTQLSVKELDDLFEVRASLLATGSRLAASKCTEDKAKALLTQLGKLHECVGDLDQYISGSSELVRALMLMSDNAVLASYIDDFAQRIGRYIRIGLSSESRRRHSLNTWSQLIAAVTTGQGEKAAMLHRSLALNNRSAALEEFSRRQSDSSQTISEPS